MLNAPATRPASPPTKIVSEFAVAPATPITIPATDTMPSLAPRTAARNQFNRLPRDSSWGSSTCGPRSSGPMLAADTSKLTPPILPSPGTGSNEGKARLRPCQPSPHPLRDDRRGRPVVVLEEGVGAETGFEIELDRVRSDRAGERRETRCR